VEKKSAVLVKTRDEAVRRYHGALMEGAGVRSRLSGREPGTQGSGRYKPGEHDLDLLH
jgi:hypothetical protein